MVNKFNKNDWDHFHDVILDATWLTSKTNLTQSEMEKMYLTLPLELKQDAVKYGMNDTCWRDELRDWYLKNN